MKFCSTRGGVRGATFEDVLRSGYAPDGGLYVPERLPHLDQAQLEQWKALDFPSLAEAILSLFVGDELDRDELKALVCSCYSGFGCSEIVPVKRVGSLFVAELFHGPTFCFKDLGQQPLIRLLARFAEKRQRRHTVMVSTTGDTGPAAMRAVSDSGSPNIDLLVFYPLGQISELQRRQMTTCSSARARVVAFEGGGDDMDAPLKRLAGDKNFASDCGLCGINSYNLCRPIAQLVHYFWTYFRVAEQVGCRIGEPIDIVIPSGALGNLAAGFMSKCMGLPLRRLVAGTNTNDITHRTISGGKFHRSENMQKTLSDAINIQVPYNMERIFYYLTGEDSSLVSSWMAEVERSSAFTLPQAWLAKMQDTFESRRIDDATMCSALRQGWEQHGYLSDPHTAVALATAWDIYDNGQSPACPVAVLATASPCKFEESVTIAIGAQQWARYSESAAFPQAAREVMAASENPFLVFEAQGGSLADTQLIWEKRARDMVTVSSNRSKL